jgi:hypothetical protein
MKEVTNREPHTFLFWLVLPIITAWLSFSYVIGLLKDKPLWSRNDNPQTNIGSQTAYIADYKEISDTNQGFVTFWFDDAWLSQYMQAYPILKSYNFPATVAVPANSIETPNYMNWAQLRTLQKNGWEITNHSLAHNCSMQNWPREKIVSEYKNSKLILWKNRLSSDIFVTPCGVDSQIMREEAQKLFIGYRTVDPGFNDLKNINYYNLKVKNIDKDVKTEDIKGWIKTAKESKLYLILVFHQIGETKENLSDETYNTKPNDFKNIVEYIKSEDIKVVVPSQILMKLIK